MVTSQEKSGLVFEGVISGWVSVSLVFRHIRERKRNTCNSEQVLT